MPGRAVRATKPSGHEAEARGAGHSAWPNTRYVINALANSMRRGVAGSTPIKDCASQQAPGSLGIFAAIRRASSLPLLRHERETVR